MSKSRLYSWLSKLRLEFWLPLPLIGLAFGIGTVWIDKQVLSQIYDRTAQLRPEARLQVKTTLSFDVVSIDAEIDRREKYTEVTIKTNDYILKELEYKFPVTKYQDVERAIAQVLNIQPEAVRKLIRYRIDD